MSTRTVQHTPLQHVGEIQTILACKTFQGQMELLYLESRRSSSAVAVDEVGSVEQFGTAAC